MGGMLSIFVGILISPIIIGLTVINKNKFGFLEPYKYFLCIVFLILGIYQTRLILNNHNCMTEGPQDDKLPPCQNSYAILIYILFFISLTLLFVLKK